VSFTQWLFGSWMDRRGGHWLQVTGRVKPGVSMTQAQADLNAIAARFAKEFPAENAGWQVRMVPLQAMIVGDLKSPLLVLLGAVGLAVFSKPGPDRKKARLWSSSRSRSRARDCGNRG
jgi:hypothetical protein